MKKYWWVWVGVAAVLWVVLDPLSFQVAMNNLAVGLSTLLMTVAQTLANIVIRTLAGPRGDASPVLAIAVVAVVVMMIMGLKKKLFGGGGGEKKGGGSH